MPRISKCSNLHAQLSTLPPSDCTFWRNSEHEFSIYLHEEKPAVSSKFETDEPTSTEFILRGPDQASTDSKLKSESGFSTTLMVSLLPVLLAGFMFFLLSGFLVKNWMQSLHICRVNLMETQKKVSIDLKNLMDLNTLAKSLRLQLRQAHIKLVLAIAQENWPLVAQTRLEIYQIQARQKQLDLTQKALIQLANVKMTSGVFKVYQELRRQNQIIQTRLPWFFNFRITPSIPRPVVLAVKPDVPDIAPVYELKPSFSEAQALSVNWISSFSSGNGDRMTWIKNSHSKRDSCSISLMEQNNRYSIKMIADKLLQRLSF